MRREESTFERLIRGEITAEEYVDEVDRRLGIRRAENSKLKNRPARRWRWWR